ncbi:MAG: hypothetical protein ACO3RV_02375 [Luteolibacter sp.]
MGGYLRDGRVEIDNKLAENAGHAAAIIFTVLENCRRNCRRHGIEPEAYLAEMLTKMAVTHDPAIIAMLTRARLAESRRRRIRIA